MRHTRSGLYILFILCLLIPNTGCRQGTGDALLFDKTETGVIENRNKIYDISVAGNGNIWVVGYYGAIYHSADNGRTWTQKDAGTNISLLSIDFINEKEGWIVGDRGIILHTSDGGAAWEKQDSKMPPEEKLGKDSPSRKTLSCAT